jgi:O-antigen ligase
LIDFRSKVATVGLVLLLGPILAAGFIEFTPEEIVQSRIERTSTVYARFGAWQNIVEELKKSPVFGIGFNNLRDVLQEKRVYVEGVKSETLAHNSFLSLAGEVGLLGLIAYLAIAGSIMWKGLILYKRGPTPRERWCGIVTISAMVAYLVHAFFDTSLYFPSITHVYMYMFVGGIAGLHGKRQPLSAAYASRPKHSWIPANVPARV